MKTVILTLMIALTACSSVPRTKFTDPHMRVMVDPDSFEAGDLVRIEQALVATGKWIVVDRAKGYRAALLEQQRAHRTDADRFDDREKWSHWGRLYGVGGIVVGHSQCDMKPGFLKGRYKSCLQNLVIVNSNTGEIMAAVENQEDGDRNEYEIALSWETTVNQLASAYPDKFEKNRDSQYLDDYRALSKEEATRQKEIVIEKVQQPADRAPAQAAQPTAKQ